MRAAFLFIALLAGSALCPAANFSLKGVCFVQRVKARSAVLRGGENLETHEQRKNPVLFSFYTGLGKPVKLKEEARQRCVSREFLDSVKAVPKEKQLQLDEPEWCVVLLDEEQKALCLMERGADGKFHFSPAEGIAWVYQTNPRSRNLFVSDGNPVAEALKPEAGKTQQDRSGKKEEKR